MEAASAYENPHRAIQIEWSVAYRPPRRPDSSKPPESAPVGWDFTSLFGSPKVLVRFDVHGKKGMGKTDLPTLQHGGMALDFPGHTGNATNSSVGVGYSPGSRLK